MERLENLGKVSSRYEKGVSLMVCGCWAEVGLRHRLVAVNSILHEVICAESRELPTLQKLKVECRRLEACLTEQGQGHEALDVELKLEPIVKLLGATLQELRTASKMAIKADQRLEHNGIPSNLPELVNDFKIAGQLERVAAAIGTSATRLDELAKIVKEAIDYEAKFGSLDKNPSLQHQVHFITNAINLLWTRLKIEEKSVASVYQSAAMTGHFSGIHPLPAMTSVH